MSKPKPLSLTHYQFLNFLQAHCLGKEQAMTAAQIAQETGISTRKQGQLKADLALHGHIVCSSCADPMGYYIPANDTEKVPYVRNMERRISAEQAALAIVYRNCPALRPTRLRTPPLAIRPSGEAVTAQMKMEELSA